MDATTMSSTARETFEEAFHRLFEEHKGMVYRGAYRVLANQQDAEDVQQRVFMRLFRRGLLPDSSDNLKGYLYKAATREALCIVRYRGLRPYADANIEDVSDPATEPRPSDIREPLLEAMAQLKPEAVQILGLIQEGYNQQEIAAMLGKSHLSIRTIVFRTRLRLEKLIRRRKTRRTK
jgi:RNA polymerase sigma-70 factor (ECF subfamily)